MNRPVVVRATSSDDHPTPGYLYGEIAQMTHANFEGCRQLTVYLLERIKKPNHNIKFKCLRIIQVCVVCYSCACTVLVVSSVQHRAKQQCIPTTLQRSRCIDE